MCVRAYALTMLDLGSTAHEWIRALHIISVIAWMAGLLYLPRLFVYHTDAAPGSEMSETLKVMERRLLRAIMTPAMIASILLGGLLVAGFGGPADWPLWLWAKLVLAFALTGAHGLQAHWRRDFAEDRNRHSQRFYRIMNEVPTVLMIGIVILVVVEPF